MNNKVIYLDKISSDIGSRKNPALIHVTRGQKDNSFVYHTKEDRKYFQYHTSQINKKSIDLKCIYANTKQCIASFKILPNNTNLIKNAEGAQKRRFVMNKEIALDEKSAEN
jgi:hypothetical protein